MAMQSKKPWKEKLRPDLEPHVEDDPRGRMLIPTPMLVAGAIRRVRRGSLTTPAAVRDALARKHGADFTCPMTTGIFLNIVAAASDEIEKETGRPLAPWWRVVEPDGRLNPKRPPGPARQATLLRGEGHMVTRNPKDVWTVGDMGASSARRTTSRRRGGATGTNAAKALRGRT
ncbi:MAG: hypothetical protein U0163_21915 [Gemmatimonadaceae bacterium]